jgi:drug/metabolite transporter (DMT)-like permease
MRSVAEHRKLTSNNVGLGANAVSIGRSKFLVSGVGAAFLANVLWGTSFLASKYTLESWGPFTASALRFLLATVLMFAGMKLFRRQITAPKSLRAWVGVFVVALTGFGLLYPFQLAGLKLVSSGMSAAIMLTSPLFVVIAGKLLLGDELTARKLTGIGIGIVGGTILLAGIGNFAFSSSSDFLLGSLLTVAASISLAISIIATRKLSKELDSGSLTFWSMGIGFVFLAVSASVVETSSPLAIISNGTARSWLALFFLSCVCSAFCFFIWNFALSKASPKEIASMMHIKTPTAVLLGVGIAGERLSPALVVGTLIMMVGVWISQTTSKESSR